MMPSSSAHSRRSSHSDSFLQLENNNIKVHEDTLSHPKDVLAQPPAGGLPHPAGTLPHPEDSTVSSRNRSQHRNVRIFDASDRNTTVGGLILTKENNNTNCVTNANLYAMVEIIVVVTTNFTLRNESEITIQMDNSPLQPGDYYIHASEPFQLSNELILCRALSLQTGTRVQAFRDNVRLRDRRCIITGEEYADDDNWRGFEAAHIFPLAYEKHWVDYNYGRWISTPDEEIKGGKINSVRNGLLLRSDIHQLFDFYDFSINPDVCVYSLCFFKQTNYIRIITRLYVLHVIGRVLLESILIKGLLIILKDQLNSFYVGILDRLF
ncbi:HNH endonuclease-domain-containing protein [Tricladium varicosporioides]|nr:HNH endonuclease-domain-containing protein [Hymenoscyphus varicosporioides]